MSGSTTNDTSPAGRGRKSTRSTRAGRVGYDDASDNTRDDDNQCSTGLGLDNNNTRRDHG